MIKKNSSVFSPSVCLLGSLSGMVGGGVVLVRVIMHMKNLSSLFTSVRVKVCAVFLPRVF